MHYVTLEEIRKEYNISRLFQQHWGSLEMDTSKGIYHIDHLKGFSAIEEGEIKGLLTYAVESGHIEIISLDSFEENKGIGTELLRVLENHTKTLQLSILQLITTNDNLYALCFYQKRGYRIKGIVRDGVIEARKRKPSIPMIAKNGIPIYDELLLEKKLD
ncbi:GNAT family N-acetyltransferase [Halobacillus mangrovi]|uniref:GNAT family N-acetyltransferase n=1 Tax=Halobacillus mangrovi TaxID=402384 RepID=UPI003D96E305